MITEKEQEQEYKPIVKIRVILVNMSRILIKPQHNQRGQHQLNDHHLTVVIQWNQRGQHQVNNQQLTVVVV